MSMYLVNLLSFPKVGGWVLPKSCAVQFPSEDTDILAMVLEIVSSIPRMLDVQDYIDLQTNE